jgi:hypothetical protein
VDFANNAVAGGDSRLYPPGNLFVTEQEFDAQFEQVSSGDFRLRVNSRFRGRASDGRDLGADMASIARAAGVRAR